jgi:membrane protein DedA with SNARE-associated domain
MNNLDIILSDLYPWSYLIISIGVMIENAGIPVPGETIMIAAGILSAAGRLDPYLVITSGTVGAIIGDNIGYWIGRKGGRKLFDRLAKNFPYVNKAMHSTEEFFKHYGGVTILVARFITGVRIFAGPFAGISLMQFKKFFIFNAIGAIVWASALVLIIRNIGKAYIKYINDYKDADYVIYILLFLLLTFVVYKIIKKLKQWS